MARLRGTGLGSGMALGTAAVVRTRGGVAIMPEMPPRIAALAAQRRLAETPEVVLVADEYRTAEGIAASISWARVVGIAAEREDRSAPVPPVPAVTGLAGLMQAAADDILVLVDATRGVALVDPDPIYLAQYTAEHDRIAPRSRLYLDEEHLPAQMQDGRQISVTAITGDAGVEAALASGPDALYHALPLTFDPSDLRRHLSAILKIAAGKQLTVPYNPSLPLTPLVEAVSQADITLALSPPDGAPAPTVAAIAQVLREIDLAQGECAENDILCGAPRIAVEVANRPDSHWPTDDESQLLVESLAIAGATRLIYYGPSNGPSLLSLSNFAACAGINLIPVTCCIGPEAAVTGGARVADAQDGFAGSLRLLIGAGVTGFLVAPGLTQAAKAAIRATDHATCVDEFTRTIAAL